MNEQYKQLTETHMEDPSSWLVDCAVEAHQSLCQQAQAEALTSRWYRNTECSRESAEPYVSNKTTASDLTNARMCRIFT